MSSIVDWVIMNWANDPKQIALYFIMNCWAHAVWLMLFVFFVRMKGNRK